MGQKYDTKAAFWDIHNNTKPGPERTAAYIKAIKLLKHTRIRQMLKNTPSSSATAEKIKSSDT